MIDGQSWLDGRIADSDVGAEECWLSLGQYQKLETEIARARTTMSLSLQRGSGVAQRLHWHLDVVDT